MVVQTVDPHTYEERVGTGMGVLVGRGTLYTTVDVGRIIGRAVAPPTRGVGTTLLLCAVGDGLRIPLGVAVILSAPFALVVNVQGTPPLSYF